MARIIVSILSAQPIPNLLFIKQMARAGDEYIFISTDTMEAQQQSKILAATLQLPAKAYRVIKVDPNNAAEILQAIDQYDWPVGQYLVNITGGTKMMSQMAYVHFSEKNDTTIYYWPIGNSKLEVLYPIMQELDIRNPVQIDLKTYFAAHGYSIITHEPMDSAKEANRWMQRFLDAGDGAKVPEFVEAKKPFSTHPNREYLSGGWFEDWMYYAQKREFALQDAQIGLSVKSYYEYGIKQISNNYEIDVALVHNNQLRIWECKALYNNQAKLKSISNHIYKIASIRQTLGLQALCYVALCAKMGNNVQQRGSLEEICRAMQVKEVVDMSYFTSYTLD